MEELKVILEYISIWLPSIAAAGGCAAALAFFLSKANKIVEVVTLFVEKHKESKEMKDLAESNRRLRQEIAVQNRKLDMVLDQLSKVKNYSEKKK